MITQPTNMRVSTDAPAGFLQSVYRRPLLASFLVFVILPTLIYAIYISFMASSTYETEFRIQIRSPRNTSAPSIGALLGMAGGSTPTSDNGYAVTQYLVSKNAITDLEKSVNLRSKYSNPSIDWFSRLPTNATIEKFQQYWGHHISANFEANTGTVIVNVTAYSAKDSRDIANVTLSLSEKMLNKMTDRLRFDSLQYARREVTDAEQEMRQIETKWLAVRNRTGIIDVPKQVSTYLTRVANIQQQVDLANVDISLREKYLAGNAPSVDLAEARLKALNSALIDARASIASRENNQKMSLAQAASLFEEMQGKRDFAEKRLQAALANFSAAEADAQRQQTYLERIVSPQLAQEPAYPRPFKDSAVFLIFAMAAWALVTVLGFAVRDHMPR